jgi:actin beta/gamma 1
MKTVQQPALLTPVELNHHTRLHGKINGQQFSLDGTGSSNTYIGFLDTCLKSTKGTVPFPMTILSPIVLRGYPIYSTYQKGSSDLFISDGYFHRRSFRFDNGGTNI